MRRLATACTTAPNPAYTTAATTAATPTTSQMAALRRTSGQDAWGELSLEVFDLDTEGGGIGREAFTQDTRIEPEFSQPVIAPRPADVAARAQPAAHACLRVLAQLETAMPVDGSDGIERTGSDVPIVQVQHVGAARRQIAH